MIYFYRRTRVVGSRIRFAVAVVVGARGVGGLGDMVGQHGVGRASFRVSWVAAVVGGLIYVYRRTGVVDGRIVEVVALSSSVH